jgi:hypothetical protein
MSHSRSFAQVLGRGRVGRRRFLVVRAWRREEVADARKGADRLASIFDVDAPYVCPGCYAVGEEPCARGCIDAEIAADRERRYLDDDPWMCDRDGVEECSE